MVLWHQLKKNKRRRRSENTGETKGGRKHRLTKSGHADFVYSNAYEVIQPTPRSSPNMEEKTSLDLYFLGSESLPTTPPPLPLRNISQSSDSITPQPKPGNKKKLLISTGDFKGKEKGEMS